MDNLTNYTNHVLSKFEKVVATQKENIKEAAKLIVDAHINDKTFFVVGSGHSHMIAEELYARAGGMANIKPILPPELMLHQHPMKSTLIERLSGYADILLELNHITEGDVILVISNSGRNSLPIEISLGAKERGAKVIALTNVAHSSKTTSRHESGKKLMDIADVIIDNCGDIGDASFKVSGLESPIGATSTIIGAYIAHAIIVQVTEYLIENNIEVPIFRSSNLDNSDLYNQELMEKYKLL